MTTPSETPAEGEFEGKTYDQIASACLRLLRGCATDEQYSDAHGRIARAVSHFDRQWQAATALLTARVAEVERERDAMQHRAEAAEDDWQKAESALAAAQATIAEMEGNHVRRAPD